MNECCDVAEIITLKGRYAQWLDAGRFDDLMELFAEDPVFDTVAFTGEVWRGKPMLRERYEQTWTVESVHVMTNPVIDVDGDHATGRWYLLACRSAGTEGGPVVGLGVYDDEYVRVDGEWKIATMTVSSLTDAEAVRRHLPDPSQAG